MNEESSKYVAFCGTRGVPANYGGFETAVDEISRRLIEKGYNCQVFCRLSSGAKPIQDEAGRQLIYIKGSKSRKLDTFVASIQTGWYIWRHRRDYKFVFWFNNANFPGILMTWLSAVPLTVNTDGLEWRRRKWSWPFKLYYIIASFILCRLCHRLISDSYAIQDYYIDRFFKVTNYIPYGYPRAIDINPNRQAEVLQKYGLEWGRFYLQITRFEPDNLPLEIAVNFTRTFLSKRGYKMVLVGYKDPTAYARKIKALDGKNDIVVIEALYDPEALAILRSSCFCYVHGNSVGGTNPALLEAMAFSPRVMAIDSEFSREVLGDTGFYFRTGELITAFRQSILIFDRSDEMKIRLEEFYRWDKVAESYINLTEGLPSNYNAKQTPNIEGEENFEEAVY